MWCFFFIPEHVLFGSIVCSVGGLSRNIILLLYNNGEKYTEQRTVLPLPIHIKEKLIPISFYLQY